MYTQSLKRCFRHNDVERAAIIEYDLFAFHTEASEPFVMKYGFVEADWDAAKLEARTVLIERASAKNTIPYSDLASQIKSIILEPHDQRLFHLLGEISTTEDAAGRGMLSAIVAHKHGDMQPGPGFFKLAQELGRDTSDIDRCWINEFNSVYAAWKS